MADLRSAKRHTTLPSSRSWSRYWSALVSMIVRLPMKRWPWVRLPAARPSTAPGTTRAPCSITSPCTGRTNCASPSPQRITFGIGSFFTARPTTPASASSSAVPPALTRATHTSPFAPGFFCSASTATPCFLANPATAAAGALADGPVTSFSSLAARSATSRTSAARRRGVARSCSTLPPFGARPSATSSSRMPWANALPSADSALGGSSSVSSSTSRLLAIFHWEAEAFAGLEISLGHRAGEGPYPPNVGGALGHRDRAARVEQVEGMRGLHHHLVARQHALRFDQPFRLAFVVREGIEKQRDVGELEVVARLLDFVLVIHIAVGDPRRPDQVIHAVLALQVHRQAFEAVGDLAEHRLAREAAHFLEVGELRDLHAVEPHFPAETPGAERGGLPVVLDEADVVLGRIDAEIAQRFEVALLDVVGRGLENHLVLVVVLQPVRVVAVAPVLRPARRLHVGRVPRLGADRAQEGRGVEGAGADFHVVRL